ncbi:organic radical activating enzyme [Candidatus Omnitrophus magneticus]|uniref:7-carboxy-7-deazaguanine synthase n=1 Tax=Candidatus Omnitrophus magneticus TaxID=1609969 RepID=A0A0F0CKH2_9BACT|nr:organic radical activating enzyme [Candidatus Omnitrophus magneticus]
MALATKNAKISEIFLSYQGEGPFAGSRQLFVRFYGCDKTCAFCDTKFTSYKSFTPDSLLTKIFSFEDNYNELSITGGEPLEHSEFLIEFLKLYKTYKKNPVYLETNGLLPQELTTVIKYIDIIAMDFKLPSSAGEILPNNQDIWAIHKKFSEIAIQKKLIIKAVVTDKTKMQDIKEMGNIVISLKGALEVVLQPVTPVNDEVKAPDAEMLYYFKRYLEKIMGRDILAVGQLHKIFNIP